MKILGTAVAAGALPVALAATFAASIELAARAHACTHVSNVCIDMWAAIAHNPATGQNVAEYGPGTQAQVEAAALAAVPGGVIAATGPECVALAGNANQWAGGTGHDDVEAMEEAMGKAGGTANILSHTCSTFIYTNPDTGQPVEPG